MEELGDIFAYVDQNFDEMIEEVKEFCSFRSTEGDKEGLLKTSKFLEEKLSQAEISYRKITEGGAPLFFAEKKGKIEEAKGRNASHPCLLFYNHYDVVEEGDRTLWTGEPFKPEIRGNILYGRGVSDNKGPLLSRIQAVKSILDVRGALPVDVKFAFDGEEETSSPSLNKFSIREPELFQDLTRADLCLWENGRRDKEGRPWARFGVRGSISFDLSVKTSKKDIHARMGTIIPSASWRLIWALASLKGEDEKIAIEGFYDDVRPVTRADEVILEAFPYDEESLKQQMGLSELLRGTRGLDLKKQLYMEPSISVCGLEAGQMYRGVRGIVPCEASARVSFYLVADQSPERVEELLRSHLKKYGFDDIQVKARGRNAPVRTFADPELIELFRRSASQAYKEPLVIEPTQLGGGPAIYFHRAWPQLPIVGVGPGNTGGNHHSPDENMKLEDYRASIKHMIALMYAMRERSC